MGEKHIWKKEKFWFFIAIAWQLIWYLIMWWTNDYGTFNITMFLIGTTYVAYIVIKQFIYAWFINPRKWWKKQLNFFFSLFKK